MESFVFHNPVKLRFGPGEVQRVGEEASLIGHRALLVTGKGHAKKSGLLDRVTGLLESAGVTVTHLGGVDPNPRLASVKEGIARCNEHDVQLVIALGGGSVMDCSKVIAAAVLYPGDPWDIIHHGQEPYFPPTESLPTMTVPTLAATGSDMNANAVITNAETKEKSFVGGEPCMYPRTCVADPELTLSVPAWPTACGAADIIAHVLESYFSGADDTPVQDRIQEGIVLTVMELAPRLIAEPDDLAGRTNLQWASIVALNGWAQAGSGGTFAMHHIEHAVSAKTDLAHGAGLAILMPAWMKIACEHRLEKYIQFAERVFGVNSNGREPKAVAHDGIACLENFLSEIGLPVRFSDAEIEPDLFESFADDAIRITGDEHGRLGGRPQLDHDGVLDVLNAAK